MAYEAPRKVGDTHKLIPAAKAKLAGNSYGKAIGADRSTTYTAAFGAALVQYGKNVHDAVAKGKRRTPDVNTAGVFDWAIQDQMELETKPAAPEAQPLPKGRAIGYVWRGTGGIVGQDYVYQVLQQCSDLVDLVDPKDPTKVIRAAGQQVAGFAELRDDGVRGLAEDDGGGLAKRTGGGEQFEGGLADAGRGGLGDNEDFRHDESPGLVCRGAAAVCRVGSATSRRPSANRLRPITSDTNARPGATAPNGAV